MAKIQNEDCKSESDLTGAGGAKSQLINDTKIYVTADSINKRLDEAITDGDIGGGGSFTATTFSDIKASGVQGGSSQTIWTARTLNNQSGDLTFASLAANQMTVDAGDYFVFGSAPAHGSGGNEPNNHKTKLRNSTDSTDALIGTSERVNLATGVAITNRSFVYGFVSIASQKTFEFQHICSLAFATSGFGEAGSFGVDEVYAQITWVKL